MHSFTDINTHTRGRGGDGGSGGDGGDVGVGSGAVVVMMLLYDGQC